MAEANGAETPHTGTAPESENTSLDPSQTRHPEPEQARRPKITRGEEGLTEWEHRTDKPLFSLHQFTNLVRKFYRIFDWQSFNQSCLLI